MSVKMPDKNQAILNQLILNSIALSSHNECGCAVCQMWKTNANLFILKEGKTKGGKKDAGRKDRDQIKNIEEITNPDDP